MLPSSSLLRVGPARETQRGQHRGCLECSHAEGLQHPAPRPGRHSPRVGSPSAVRRPRVARRHRRRAEEANPGNKPARGHGAQTAPRLFWRRRRRRRMRRWRMRRWQRCELRAGDGVSSDGAQGALGAAGWRSRVGCSRVGHRAWPPRGLGWGSREHSPGLPGRTGQLRVPGERGAAWPWHGCLLGPQQGKLLLFWWWQLRKEQGGGWDGILPWG